MFHDADPDEVARRGHHYQTRSRHASIAHTKLHSARSCDEAENKQNKSLRCVDKLNCRGNKDVGVDFRAY